MSAHAAVVRGDYRRPPAVLAEPGGLRLRRATTDDIPHLARWFSDPRVLAYYRGRDRPLSRTGVRDLYFTRGRDQRTGRFFTWRRWIVELEGRPIGVLHFYQTNPVDEKAWRLPPEGTHFGMSYLIGLPELWGQGIGPRAIALVKDHLFRRYRATTITATVRVSNRRSRRALEKAGFRVLCRLRHWKVHEGRWEDGWVFIAETSDPRPTPRTRGPRSAHRGRREPPHLRSRGRRG